VRVFSVLLLAGSKGAHLWLRPTMIEGRRSGFIGNGRARALSAASEISIPTGTPANTQLKRRPH